jgi:hypothetical protein
MLIAQSYLTSAVTASRRQALHAEAERARQLALITAPARVDGRLRVLAAVIALAAALVFGDSALAGRFLN